jgi:putative thioredoxin
MADSQSNVLSYDVQDFNKEVIEQSHSTPVLVDFWAEWCAPCRMLSPVLERLAEQAEEKWVLAKLNTENHADIARQFRISSIPNVKLFVEGKVTSEFVGVLPEYAIKQWLEKNIPSRVRKQLEASEVFLKAGNTEAAQTLLHQILEEEPNNKQAKVMLATTLMFSNPQEAHSLIQNIDDHQFNEQVESLKTITRLLQLSADALPEKPIKVIYLEAIALLKNQQFDKALQKYIDVIRDDRYYDDDGARKACIAIFKFLGEENEFTQKYRREFSSALYV